MIQNMTCMFHVPLGETIEIQHAHQWTLEWWTARLSTLDIAVSSCIQFLNQALAQYLCRYTLNINFLILLSERKQKCIPPDFKQLIINNFFTFTCAVIHLRRAIPLGVQSLKIESENLKRNFKHACYFNESLTIMEIETIGVCSLLPTMSTLSNANYFCGPPTVPTTVENKDDIQQVIQPLSVFM